MKEYIWNIDIPENDVFNILAGGVSVCDGSFYLERNNSKCYYFGQILKGYGRLIINKNTIELEPGDIYLLPKHSEHIYYSYEDDPIRSIWFDANGKLIENLLWAYGLATTYVVKKKYLKHYFNQFLSIMKNRKIDQYDSAYILFHQFIHEIYRHTSSIKDSSDISLAEKIKIYLDGSLEKKISLEELAKDTFSSKSQIIHAFKKQYGQTPYEYLIHYRIQYAKLLIETSKTLSIKEIAARLSFADSHHFSNTFRKYISVSPSYYRKTIHDPSGLLAEVSEMFVSLKKEPLLQLIKRGLAVGINPTVIAKNGLLDPLCSLYEGNGKEVRDMEPYLSIFEESLSLIKSNSYRSSSIPSKIGISVIIGCVEGEFHDIGARIAAMALSSRRFSVINLGNNVGNREFIDNVIAHKAKAIFISASHNKSVGKAKELINDIKKAGLWDSTLIAIGGACLDHPDIYSLRADVYIDDAFNAGLLLINKLNRHMELDLTGRAAAL